MSFFENVANLGHESIHQFHDAQTGLKAIIAIHSTALGPGGGGCRMWHYENEAQGNQGCAASVTRYDLQKRNGGSADGWRKSGYHGRS